MRKFIIYCFLLSLVFLTIGFFNFNKKIQYQDTTFNKFSEGIAVLTGGQGRIKLGLELLEIHKNMSLIISGVDKKVTTQSIIPSHLENNNIILDKESESTFQNALVISKWIKKNNLGKVTIITSYYHMPRTMLLLKTLSPESEFFVHPVKKNSIKENLFKDNMYYYLFLTEEYIKYLLSHLIIIV